MENKSLYKIESEYLELFARIEMADGELTPDKNAIKKAIEQGQEVTGCRIVENINLQIK